MGKREKTKEKLDRESEEFQKSVILLSSDDEANEDLSLKIVEKERLREGKRKRKHEFDEFEAFVIDLSSSSCEENARVADPSSAADGGVVLTSVVPGEVKKKKKKKKKSNKIEAGEKTIVALKPDEQPEIVKAVETVESVQTDAAGTSDNIVLRKLLRGPRYFNLQDDMWEMCYNCGEEGHMAVNCTMQKPKKPCFLCGSLDHIAKFCTQGQDCFICKRRGHRAKDCPEKHHNSKICLRCGDIGHDMFSCRNSYASDDLKEIQCYICKAFGHLCCVDYVDIVPREVSCYNCGKSGHTGLGCAKSRGDIDAMGSPTLCYKCGEEGHFARGCTKSSKFDRKMGGFSTPSKRFSKNGRESLGFRSAPYDLGKAHKKKKVQYEEREFTTTGKRRKQRGGWITDDPGDLPCGKAKFNGWRSPATPTNKGHKFSTLMAGHYTCSQSPRKKLKPLPVTPISHNSAKSYQNRYSASRFGKFSCSRRKRNYDW